MGLHGKGTGEALKEVTEVGFDSPYLRCPEQQPQTVGHRARNAVGPRGDLLYVPSCNGLFTKT